MLLSFRHRFIFFHIWKTAGTSIQKALGPYANNAEKFGLRDHCKARELVEIISVEFESFFKFAVVRNPWELEVSIYEFGRKCFLEKHPSNNWTRDYTFEEFILKRASERTCFGDQLQFVVDYDGKLLVDYIARFENIHQDFTNICKILGVSACLPHLNTVAHRPYPEYYTPRLREIVRRISRPEIQMFGYNFDPEAGTQPSSTPSAPVETTLNIA